VCGVVFEDDLGQEMGGHEEDQDQPGSRRHIELGGIGAQERGGNGSHVGCGTDSKMHPVEDEPAHVGLWDHSERCL